LRLARFVCSGAGGLERADVGRSGFEVEGELDREELEDVLRESAEAQRSAPRDAGQTRSELCVECRVVYELTRSSSWVYGASGA
jgi:hypothetical protein